MIFFRRSPTPGVHPHKGRDEAAYRTARPLVVIQSDDWGRVGIPSRATIDRLRARGLPVGESPWDFYGLETEDDVATLGRLLSEFADRDGNSPRMTANFIMANADLPRMRAERFADFRWVAIEEGWPSPWDGNLMAAYRAVIRNGVFEAGLHGFTHFNARTLLDGLRSDSDCGRRARILVEQDVPYLASVTPEYNFALVNRTRGEKFLDRRSQQQWIETGASLFVRAFGSAAKTVCAPGYRANAVTRRLWREAGAVSVQVVGRHAPRFVDGLVELPRNVMFEPVLTDRDALAPAMEEARSAAARGIPIIICTHSINYISRFLAAADHSRDMLRRLLDSLLTEFPDLRFSGSVELADAWMEGRAGWFETAPTAKRPGRIAHGPR